MNPAAGIFDSLTDHRMRANFAAFCVLVPRSFVDRCEDSLGQIDGSGTCGPVYGWRNPSLNADHKVVQLVQDRVSRFQFQGLARSRLLNS